MRRPTAKSFVLDLLRVTPGGGARPARTIVAVGELLGFKAGAIRAAMSRLLASGRIEQDERASYRIAASQTALGAFVEEWRHGERRRRRWDGGWLVALLPKAPERTASRHAERALDLLGFARADGRLWTRPDNLARPRADLDALLAHLGLMPDASLFVASDLARDLLAQWSELWPVADLKKRYVRTSKAIEKSLARLDRLPTKEALPESFAVGGEGIRVLARDPLLPTELLPSAERERLFELTTEYDRIGRALWLSALEAGGYDEAPG